MFNSGWANDCGIEQFTLGWVKCDIYSGGGRKRRKQIIIGDKKEPIDPVIEEEFKGTVLPPVVETALGEVLATGSATVDGVIVEFDSVPSRPEKPISLLAPDLDKIVSSIDKDLAEIIRAQELQRYEELLLKYELDVRSFEEEFVVFLMLISES